MERRRFQRTVGVGATFVRDSPVMSDSGSTCARLCREVWPSEEQKIEGSLQSAYVRISARTGDPLDWFSGIAPYTTSSSSSLASFSRSEKAAASSRICPILPTATGAVCWLCLTARCFLPGCATTTVCLGYVRHPEDCPPRLTRGLSARRQSNVLVLSADSFSARQQAVSKSFSTRSNQRTEHREFSCSITPAHTDTPRRTGAALQRILDPYMTQLEHVQQLKARGEQIPVGEDVKPINVIVLTDGAATGTSLVSRLKRS